MIKFIIYSREDCIWCERATDLLETKGYEYIILTYGIDYDKEDLREIVGPDTPLTTPQILFEGKLVGGYNELLPFLNGLSENEEMQGRFPV